jgi:hypothetical protein
MSELSDKILEDLFLAYAKTDEQLTRVVADATRMAKLSWNMKADQFNQWDDLGGDEQEELILQELRK